MTGMTTRREAVLMLSLVALGCTAGVSSPGAPTVSVSPATAQLLPFEQQAFAATVAGTLNTTVSWSVVEGDAGGTVGPANGLYTAPGSAGLFHVMALEPVSGMSGQAQVTVTAGTGAGNFSPSTARASSRERGRRRRWSAAPSRDPTTAPPTASSSSPPSPRRRLTASDRIDLCQRRAVPVGQVLRACRQLRAGRRGRVLQWHHPPDRSRVRDRGCAVRQRVA